MSDIKTVVYFDIEATRLKNSGSPRITEVSVVAVNAKDVLELHSKIMNYFKESKIEAGSIVPRIVNKLSVCSNLGNKPLGFSAYYFQMNKCS